LHSPPKTHEDSQAQEERRVVKESGIISMLRLLKYINIIKAKIISMCDTLRRI